jgi:hypothetical protein
MPSKFHIYSKQSRSKLTCQVTQSAAKFDSPSSAIQTILIEREKINKSGQLKSLSLLKNSMIVHLSTINCLTEDTLNPQCKTFFR